MCTLLLMEDPPTITWRTDGTTLFYSPPAALDDIPMNMARDLKPELVVLLGFTGEPQEIIPSLDSKVNLERLSGYREGLKFWKAFTLQGLSPLLGHLWGPYVPPYPPSFGASMWTAATCQ